MEQVTKYLEPYQHVPAVAEYRENLKVGSTRVRGLIVICIRHYM